MTETCKNCGAEIKDDAKFCPDCGTKINEIQEEEEINYCENCGNKLTEEDEFCSECGTDLKNPQPHIQKPKQKSFIEENKIPIAIVGIVAIVVLSLLLLTAMPKESDDYTYDPGTQTVEVGDVDFVIPGDYRLVPNSIDYDYVNYVSSYTHTYSNYDETITITVMYSPGSNVDANEVNDQTGGVKKTMCGYEGYYNELSDGYLFSFGKGNKLCMICVSSPYILDEITVL